MALLPDRSMFNVANIALIGFSAIITVLLIHLLTMWAEQQGLIENG